MAGFAPQCLLTGIEVQVSMIDWASHKSTQVCRSAGSTESNTLTDGEDTCSAMIFCFAEVVAAAAGSMDDVTSRCPCTLVTDSKNTYDNLLKNGAHLSMKEKMAGLPLKVMKQRCVSRHMSMRWVHGDVMLANPLTKSGDQHQTHQFYKRSVC